MQSISLPRRFITFGLFLLIGGCALGNRTLADQQDSNVATFSSPLSYQVYNILAAEMFIRQENPAQAALHYVAAAQQSADLTLAKRAVELASSTSDNALTSRALDRWLALEPNAPEALQYRALNNLRTGQYEAAAQDLVKVRDKVEKEEGHGLEFILSLLALEQDAAKAYEVFKQYVNTADKSAPAQLALASLAINSEQFEDALQAGKTVKQSGDKPQQEQASLLVAKALAGQGKVNDALAELEATAKTSKNPDIKREYARLLIMAERREEAAPLFKQLYASEPDNIDILYTLGLLYLEQKNFAEAEPLIKKLQQVPDRASEASYFLGQIYESQQRPKEAIAAYQSATNGNFTHDAMGRIVKLLLDTQGLDAARQWLAEQEKETTSEGRKILLWQIDAQLLDEKGRYQEAMASINKGLALKPDNFDLLYARALIAEKAGKFADAETDLRTLIKQQPDNATILNALGYMLAVNTERYPEARELISKAVKLRTDDPAIMDSMGWILFRSGELAEAESWLRKAYNLLQDPEVASHLVEVLVANGKKPEAATLLQDMLKKFPDDQRLLKVKAKVVGL